MTNLEKLANKAMSRWPRKNIRDSIVAKVDRAAWRAAGLVIKAPERVSIPRILGGWFPEPFIWGPGDLFDCKTGNYPKDTSPYSAEEE